MKGKKKRYLIISVLLMGSMLAGCSQPASSDEAAGDGTAKTDGISLHLAVETYPKVDGSTATIPLSEAFGAAVMGMSVEEARQYILHNTTHNAYLNLIDKKADIIFVTSPSEEELAYAKQNGVTGSGADRQ
ncbi:MAG TPA: hypothetical protein VM577_02035 [Anaerovoracaceae bacterium]|nr:hypothetical protein [Anaerovoracaceae bacterium]